MLNDGIREISDDEMDRLAGGTGQSGKIPHINLDACVDCATCSAICPQACLFVDDKNITFYHDRCIGCGECAAVCPAKAISMY